MKIRIPSNLLKAVSCFAAEPKAQLPSLVGVRVETSSPYVRITAVNGHALLTIRVKNPDEAAVVKPFTIPSRLLSKLTGKGEVLVEVLDGTVYVTEGSRTEAAPEISERYPDYQHVIPRAMSGEPALFAGPLLGLFGKACALLYGKKASLYPIQILQNGPSGAVVMFTPTPGLDIIGVIMPCRSESGARAVDSSTPRWVYDEE